jgi:hypothetical protein
VGCDGISGPHRDENPTRKARFSMTDTSADPCTFTPASTEWIKTHLDRMDHAAPPGNRHRDTEIETPAPTAGHYTS